jgi:hypothetical protein
MEQTGNCVPAGTSAKTRRRIGFREADLARALRAALRAGLHISTARIDRDGCIELVFGATQGVLSATDTNPWDR